MFPKDLAALGKTSQISNLFDVKGKVVVVTGGSRGIGLMIAQGFIVNGAKVIIISRKAKDCDEAVEALNKIGPGTSYAIAADLSKESECKRVVEEISKKESTVHVLVNNAGAAWGEDIATYPDSAWDKLIALNLKSIFFLTRTLLPLLEKGFSQSGVKSRVINLGSIDGIWIPYFDTYAYSASKAAVHHLTRVLASKLAAKNITVNAIAAGGFETKMTAGIFEMRPDATSNVPLGRSGQATDAAGVCIYLSSLAGEWVTGAIIVVDGGAITKPLL